MGSNIRIEKVCEYCKQKYEARTIKTRYCSHTCNRKDYKQKERNVKIESVTRPVSPVSIKVNMTATDYDTLSKKELLTINEASQLLNITSVTLRRWINGGLIKTKRIGKKHIIKRAEINALL
jgi:excisionase family DNA binding protein